MTRTKSWTSTLRSPIQGFTVLVLLALIITGCSKSTPAPGQPKPAQEGEATDAGANVDGSLTSDEYIRLGLPAPDRVWFAADMVKAEKILSSLAEKGQRQLPRYMSERSGEVFARMTSPQNLDFFKDRTLPLESRYPQALDYLQAGNQINKLYMAGFLKKETRDIELVEWFGVLLRMTVVMFELAEELLPSIKKDDPTYPIRMQGLEKMKRGYAGVVIAGLMTLSEREHFRTSELVRLIGYMKETFPGIVPHLPPGTHTEVLLRLEKMQEDPSIKDLQPGLGELYAEVKASVEKGANP